MMENKRGSSKNIWGIESMQLFVELKNYHSRNAVGIGIYRQAELQQSCMCVPCENGSNRNLQIMLNLLTLEVSNAFCKKMSLSGGKIKRFITGWKD